MGEEAEEVLVAAPMGRHAASATGRRRRSSGSLITKSVYKFGSIDRRALNQQFRLPGQWETDNAAKTKTCLTILQQAKRLSLGKKLFGQAQGQALYSSRVHCHLRCP